MKNDNDYIICYNSRATSKLSTEAKILDSRLKKAIEKADLARRCVVKASEDYKNHTITREEAISKIEYIGDPSVLKSNPNMFYLEFDLERYGKKMTELIEALTKARTCLRREYSADVLNITTDEIVKLLLEGEE